jgi:hypothetical protein
MEKLFYIYLNGMQVKVRLAASSIIKSEVLNDEK